MMWRQTHKQTRKTVEISIFKKSPHKAMNTTATVIQMKMTEIGEYNK